LRYRIDADPGVSFVASEGGGMAIGPTLYFQRSGDDWQADGRRWFAAFATPAPMKAGESEIIASFDQNWTSTETMSRAKNPQAFADALADTVRLGFVFGGGNGYGHGAYATGKAKFTLLEFIPA
jgi:hypothetical protein